MIGARKATMKRTVKEWLGGLNSCAYSPQNAVSLQFRHKVTEMEEEEEEESVRKAKGK